MITVGNQLSDQQLHCHCLDALLSVNDAKEECDVRMLKHLQIKKPACPSDPFSSIVLSTIPGYTFRMSQEKSVHVKIAWSIHMKQVKGFRIVKFEHIPGYGDLSNHSLWQGLPNQTAAAQPQRRASAPAAAESAAAGHQASRAFPQSAG